MKIQILFLLPLILISCQKTDNENASLIPLEYCYPKEKIGSGKIFHFNRIGGIRDENKTYLRLVKESGTEYLLYCNYENDYKIDSVKASINGKLLETYNFNLYKIEEQLPLKGEIIENRIIKDGSQFGKRNLSILYKGKERSILITEQEKYLYDTILVDKGLDLKCFVTETRSIIKYSSKSNQIAKEEIIKKSYFGKGRGLFCYSIEKKDDSSKWYESYIENIEK